MMDYLYIALASIALMAGIYAYGYNNGADAVRAQNMKETLDGAKDAAEIHNNIARAPDGAAALSLRRNWSR